MDNYDFKPAFERLCAVMEIEIPASDYNRSLIRPDFMSAWATAMMQINEESYLD